MSLPSGLVAGLMFLAIASTPSSLLACLSLLLLQLSRAYKISDRQSGTDLPILQSPFSKHSARNTTSRNSGGSSSSNGTISTWLHLINNNVPWTRASRRMPRRCGPRQAWCKSHYWNLLCCCFCCYCLCVPTAYASRDGFYTVLMLVVLCVRWKREVEYMWFICAHVVSF